MPECDKCDGRLAPFEFVRSCSNCEWHEHTDVGIMYAETLTCPECGHEW